MQRRDYFLYRANPSLVSSPVWLKNIASTRPLWYTEPDFSGFQMKRYAITIRWLLLFFAVSVVIPSAMDADSHAKSGHDLAISSQSVSPATMAISEPTQFRGRISSSLISAGWHGEDLKNSKITEFQYIFSHRQGVGKSEITLFSLDCMLQI
jgi:hypothetical protein